MKNYCIIFFISLLLCSCDEVQKSDELISKSPDGKAEISIKGTKTTFADPWETTIKMSGYGHDQSAELELYPKKLNKEAVTFNWQTNNLCKVVVKEMDDSPRTLVIEILPEKLDLHEE
jgi:hypothetical protein